jgi:hypothetical protein
MFRILATLAFMAGFDLFLYDGKYMHAAEWMALSILQHL